MCNSCLIQGAKKICVLLLVLLCSFISVNRSYSQNLYYPPLFGNVWDTLSPQQLGWCTSEINSLYNFLDSSDSKAFLVLKDGKIVLEKYFGNFTADSSWYWASAGKSLTSLLIGLAQQDGCLSISDSSSLYLGNGWTSCVPAKEGLITVRDQLKMTTGLNDAYSFPDCTDDTCLTYLADAGTRWAYHNAPYTLLDEVLQNACGQTLNSYVLQKLSLTTGLTGLYISLGYNNVFFSTARSAARFGLLILGKGVWNGNVILSDTAYYQQMLNTSQSYNQAYGYLWWLNGTNTFMLPGSQLVFNGSLAPSAPPDMYAAIGKNAQIISIVPSQNLIVIRFGNSPDTSFVPVAFTNQLWTELNKVICTSTHQSENSNPTLKVFPNPVKDVATINFPQLSSSSELSVYDVMGQIILQKTVSSTESSIKLDLNYLPSGIYVVRLVNSTYVYQKSILKL